MSTSPWYRSLSQSLYRMLVGFPGWVWRKWYEYRHEPWQIAATLFSVLLLLAFGYRLAMISVLGGAYQGMAGSPSVPAIPSWIGFRWMADDLVVAGWIAGLFWIGFRWIRSQTHRFWVNWLEGLVVFFLHVLLFVIFVIVVAHYQLMATMRTGLSYDVMMETTGGDMWFTLKAVNPLIWPLLLSPWVLFWLFMMCPRSWQTWMHRGVGGFILLVLLLQMVPAHSSTKRLGPEYRKNPVLYTLSDLLRSWRNSDQDDSESLPPSPQPILRQDSRLAAKTPGQATGSAHRTQSGAVGTVKMSGSGYPASPLARLNQPRTRGSQQDGPSKADIALCQPTQAQMQEPPPLPSSPIPGQPTAPNPHRTTQSGQGAFATQIPLPWPENTAESYPRSLSTAQLRSLQLIDPLWASSQEPIKRVPALKQPWNVLFIFLESVGSRYVFDQSKGNRVPMPFLQKLSKEGWWMQKHYSPSNSSPRSAFAILSGLYPRPQMRMFSTQKENYVPSLVTLLGPHYDAFLVNPSPLGWFFPRSFLYNSGMRELHGFHSLPVKKLAPKVNWSRDERETFAFFVDRLKKAKKPFVSIYWSFIAHWPYPDYGPETHVLPPNTRLHQYYNNLSMLDQHIAKLFETLRNMGELDNTIVVITGDHGEAFGQHPGNWAHSRQSYNENYQTPALIWQPKLFAPRVIDFYTSHIDIMPTLLDAMHIPYNPKLLQGESLWQTSLRRRYLFLYGNENTLSSLSYENIKLQYSFKHQTCWVFDLNIDPDEKQKLDCFSHPIQQQATVLFRKYQTDILDFYNRASMPGNSVFGLRYRHQTAQKQP